MWKLLLVVDSIDIVARAESLKANPAATKLVEVASISINDVSAENRLIADEEDSSDAIDKHAADWMAANQSAYDGWLAEARKAAEQPIPGSRKPSGPGHPSLLPGLRQQPVTDFLGCLRQRDITRPDDMKGR